MKRQNISIFLVFNFLFCSMAFADSKFYWPQPDAPYKETEPFIEPVEKDRQEDKDLEDEGDHEEVPLEEDNELIPVPLEDHPLKQLPLEDDPLLRTPLEEEQEQEGILEDMPTDDDPLPEHPLEDVGNPMSVRILSAPFYVIRSI